MAEKRQYKACEHPKNIVHYCESCNLFICEECTQKHLDHIEKVCGWDSQIKEYLQEWRNQQSRARVLVKTKVDEAKLKGELNGKCEGSFKAIKDKLEIARQKLKDDIWARRDKPKLVDDPRELEKLEKEINSHTSVIEKFLEVEDKEGLLKQLGTQSELPQVEKRLDVFKHQKTAALLHAKEIKDFMISETFDDESLEDLLSYGAPFMKGEVTHRHFFPTKLWTRSPGQPQTISCPLPLPAFFAVTLKKKKGMAGLFGLSKKPVQPRVDEIGSKEGEYAIRGDGALVNNGQTTMGNPPTMDADTIIIRYEKTKKLTFEYAGKKQAKGFDKIDGPFYLTVTLPKEANDIQIHSVDKI